MPDQQTRKLNIIEEVLHLESDEGLAQLEQLLAALRITPAEDEFPLMPHRSAAEIKARYEQSLRELEAGEGLDHEQVVAMFTQRPAQ